jgi:hypothetical protein
MRIKCHSDHGRAVLYGKELRSFQEVRVTAMHAVEIADTDDSAGADGWYRGLPADGDR